MSGSCKGNTNAKRLLISTILIGFFTLFEAIGGFYANSLALLADAGHMFADFIALLLSYLSLLYGKMPSDHKRSYGYKRLEIIAAFVNSLALFIIGIIIIYEATGRCFQNETVNADIMLPVAIIGVAINVIVFFILHGSNHKNLNMKSAILHIIGDVLGFVAAIIAAVIISYTGWMLADPILSILVSFMIFRTAYSILKESIHILLEGVPLNLSEEKIKVLLLEKFDLIDVHHVHLWSITEDYIILTMHIVIRDRSNDMRGVNGSENDSIIKSKNNIIGNDVLLKAIKDELKKIGIEHSTIEVEMPEQQCSDED